MGKRKKKDKKPDWMKLNQPGGGKNLFQSQGVGQPKKPKKPQITEIYQATYVPPQVPNFVDPHITDNMDGTYLFEINPNHPDALQLREQGEIIMQVLVRFGFENVQHVYTGKREIEWQDANILGSH